MNNWKKIAPDLTIKKTIAALKENGIEAFVVEDKIKAKEKALAMIPQDAEVMDMTSVTLQELGLLDVINSSKTFDVVKNKLAKMNRKTQHLEMQKHGAAPEWAIGSVHAVTQDGKVIIASNTGSQLPAYAYGSSHVLWIIGAQKLVKDVEEGLKRIYEYVLPQEAERARKAYGSPGSNVSKLLIINKEVHPKRIKMIIVKEPLGY